MAERVVRNLENDYLMCSICLGRYRDPRLLPCGHSFCRKCLEDHVRQTVSERGALSFSCPNDRTQITRPGNIAPKDWASAFPVDTFLSSLLNAVMIHAAPGNGEGQENAQMCKDHGGRMKEFYCIGCHETACPYCVVKNHKRKKCECIGIDEAVDKVRPKIESLRLKLQHQVQGARRLTNGENLGEETLRITKENAMHDLTDFETKLNFFFNTAKKQLDDMKQTIMEAGVGKLSENQQVVVMLQNMNETIDKFDNVCNHGSGAEVLDIVRKVAKQTKEYDHALANFKINSAPVQVHFVPNKYMENVFENAPALGSIAVSGAKEPEIRPTFNAAMSNMPFLATPRDQYMTARMQRSQSLPQVEAATPTRRRALQGNETSRQTRNKISISVKSANNPASCWQLTGVAFVGDYIIVADARNNLVRKCFLPQSNSTSVFSQLMLECPVSVCPTLDSTDVMVTLPEISQVVTLGTDETLVIKDEIITQKPYEGICPLSDSMFVASCCVIGKQCVEVINIEGAILKTFDKDSNGQPLFSWPRFISTTVSGNIVISDRDQRSVFCIDREGTPIWTFVASASPWGISGHESGNIYLCLDSGIVQVLSEDGRLVQNKFVTKRDGVNIPYAIHAKGENVAMSEWGGSLFAPNSPWVHVFALHGPLNDY